MSLISRLKCIVYKMLIDGKIVKAHSNGNPEIDLVEYGISLKYSLTGPDLIRLCPLNFVCNAKCKMCWLRQFDAEELKMHRKNELASILPIEAFENLFETVPPNLRTVELVGGGEPLLYPDIKPLMKLIRKKNIIGQLTSNGISLDYELSKMMVEIKWNHIRISVNAGDRETYKTIVGVDRFDTVKKNLITYNKFRNEAGVKHKCELVTFFVLQRENIQTLSNIFNFCKEVGADYIVFDIIHPFKPEERLTLVELTDLAKDLKSFIDKTETPFNHEVMLNQIEKLIATHEHCDNASSSENDNATAPPELCDNASSSENDNATATPELCDNEASSESDNATATPELCDNEASPENKTIENLNPEPPKPGFIPGKYCIIGFKNTFITADGFVHPCCFSSERMGNIRDNRFDEIWFGEKYSDFRRRLMAGKFPQYCIDNWCAFPEVIQ